jgi:tetratricopeptide (TPR) repeat protein
MSKRLAFLEAQVQAGRADSFGRYALAMEYRKLGRLEDALDAFEELRRSDPDYLPTYQMAAQLLTELDRLDEARPWLETGVELAKRQGNHKTCAELQEALDELQ